MREQRAVVCAADVPMAKKLCDVVRPESGWEGPILEVDIEDVFSQPAPQLYEANPQRGWAHPDEISEEYLRNCARR